ncbi:unnamed protein product [Echinostoma caproni]|uniref:TORC_N domain-containing protein n=1 Tax=Echinostoma caproni TaxID=27848 RepID=A0A183B2J9_9TREM|nr:unnamed protein product [Echinostoma caproni]
MEIRLKLANFREYSNYHVVKVDRRTLTCTAMTTGTRQTVTTTAAFQPPGLTNNSGRAAGDAGSISLSGWSEDAASLKTLDRLIGVTRYQTGTVGSSIGGGVGPSSAAVVGCIRENGESMMASSVETGAAGATTSPGGDSESAGITRDPIQMNGYHDALSNPGIDSVSQHFQHHSRAPHLASDANQIPALETDSYCNFYEGSGGGSSTAGQSVGQGMLGSFLNYNHIDAHPSFGLNVEASTSPNALIRGRSDHNSNHHHNNIPSSQHNALNSVDPHGQANINVVTGTTNLVTHPPLCSSLIGAQRQNELPARLSSLSTTTYSTNEPTFLPRSLIAELNSREYTTQGECACVCVRSFACPGVSLFCLELHFSHEAQVRMQLFVCIKHHNVLLK